MRHHVRLVVLIRKRLDWLHPQDCHVFRHRVAGGLIVLHRNQLVGVLDPKNLQHLPVELWQVVNLRSPLGQLQRRLILHDPLRHRCGVGIADRDHLNYVVVGLLRQPVPTLWGVGIIRRHEVADDLLKQLKFHPQAGMDTSLHR